MQSTWVAKAATPVFSFIYLFFSKSLPKESDGAITPIKISALRADPLLSVLGLFYIVFSVRVSSVDAILRLCASFSPPPQPAPFHLPKHISGSSDLSPPPFSGVLVLFVVLLGGHWVRGWEAAFFAVSFKCIVGGWVPYTVPLAHAKQLKN